MRKNFKPCKLDGCEKQVFGYGYCSMHYKRWRKTGDPGPAESSRQPDRGCQVAGCPEPHCALGFCNTHHARFRATGEVPTTPIRGREPKSVCTVWFCDRQAKTKGLCARHYGRQKSWEVHIPGMQWGLYRELWEAQDGKCAICDSEMEWDGKMTHVDHAHDTGAIRGLLCNTCNVMLGSAHDNPELLLRGVAYLQHALSSD